MKSWFKKNDPAPPPSETYRIPEMPDLPPSDWRTFVKSPTKWNKLHLPMPLYALLVLKTDEDRLQHLRRLPVHSLEKLTTALVYVLLKGNVLHKVMQLGITVPEAVASFVGRIEEKVKQTGELTLQSVQKAVQTVQDTASALLAITFAVVLLLHPLALTIMAPVLIAGDLYLFFRDFDDPQPKKR